jgi:hypothetical protein
MANYSPLALAADAPAIRRFRHLCLRSLAGPASPPDIPLHAYLGVGQRRASVGMQLRAIIREWLQLYAAALIKTVHLSDVLNVARCKCALKSYQKSSANGRHKAWCGGGR